MSSHRVAKATVGQALACSVDGVRVARPDDRDLLTSNVAAAFAGDPAWSFLLADEYHRLAPLFAGALFDTRVGSGTVWVTADLAAVAMWDGPNGDEALPAQSEAVWREYRAAAGALSWGRLREYERAIDDARTSTSYWYLGVLATRPDRQGEGLATAVMKPVLERADREGLDCCLETSTVDNRQFYERRGFTEATTVHIRSGPPTWWLRRTPQGS